MDGWVVKLTYFDNERKREGKGREGRRKGRERSGKKKRMTTENHQEVNNNNIQQ